jgi:hypothetical protein
MEMLKSRATLVLCIISAFCTSVVLNTQQVKAQKVCSNSSLNGTYEAEGKGYVNNTAPAAQTALNNFDGNGKMTGTVVARSVGGNVGTNIGIQATYQVNSDCSFTLNVTRTDGTTANYSGVVYDNGNKFAQTETDPGTTFNVQGEKVNSYYRAR